MRRQNRGLSPVPKTAWSVPNCPIVHNLESGTRWPNAFTARARMISVQQGDERRGEWVRYRRDLGADWRAAFDEAPGTIHGVAIMTDSDNTGSRATARYGTIRFSADE